MKIKTIIRKAASLLICIIICLSGTAVYRQEVSASRNSRIMVSMGDSYSAGEGIRDDNGRTAFYGQNLSHDDKYSQQNQDWAAHRSELSWPGRLHMPNETDAMSTLRGDQWYFVAASGAETQHITETFTKNYCHDDSVAAGLTTIPHSGQINLDPQIEILNELRDSGQHVDYVTLTLGGNDAGFSSIISEAVTTGSRNRYIFVSGLSDKLEETWDHYYNSYTDENGNHVDSIRDRLINAYATIYGAVDSDTIILVAGYPRLINESGGGLINDEEAQIINNSCTAFNNEIQNCVRIAQASTGAHISYVSVEEAFMGHGAYSSDPYINEVIMPAQSEDLIHVSSGTGLGTVLGLYGGGGVASAAASSYSVHPNDAGAAAYAACVQAKIDEIEDNGGEDPEWIEPYESEERLVALTLDTSGSMDGEPIDETRTAALEFVQEVFNQDAGVAVVTFDSEAYVVSPFTNNLIALRNVIDNISSGGGTNIEDGLRAAYELLRDSDAEHRMIFLMGDGMPTYGLGGQNLINFANDIKDDGITIYTLGFFQALSSSERAEAQALLSAIASEGNYYDVANANDIVYAFDDIAKQISGTRYIYIRIECPVDVSVEYNGEELNSNSRHLNTRTDFGTLSILENPDDPSDPIKVLRLEEGAEYTINIEGYGKGRMDYTIQFMDEDGEYTDIREFRNIPITRDTVITTVAGISDATYLEVDEDGDGKTDIYYKAEADSKAEILTNKGMLTTFWYVLAFVGVMVVFVWIRKIIDYIKYHKYLKDDELPPSAGNGDNVVQPLN